MINCRLNFEQRVKGCEGIQHTDIWENCISFEKLLNSRPDYLDTMLVFLGTNEGHCVWNKAQGSTRYDQKSVKGMFP